MDIGSRGGAWTKKSPKLLLVEWTQSHRQPKPRYKSIQADNFKFSCKASTCKKMCIKCWAKACVYSNNHSVTRLFNREQLNMRNKTRGWYATLPMTKAKLFKPNRLSCQMRRTARKMLLSSSTPPRPHQRKMTPSSWQPLLLCTGWQASVPCTAFCPSSSCLNGKG